METTGADPAASGAGPSGRSGVRSRLGLVRNQAIAPIMARLDAIDDRLGQVSARIDEQSRRIDAVDAFMQSLEARVSTATERMTMHVESEVRLRARIDAIAESLGAAPGAAGPPGGGDASGVTSPGWS